MSRFRLLSDAQWSLLEEMLPRPELIAVLAASDVFVCPSVYEPLGIVNLEAMAVGLPVVGSATGGIPDVIVDGETGLLVPIEQLQDGTGTPIEPERFVADLADALTRLVTDEEAAARMGAASRKRVEEHFAWTAIAERTMDVYEWALANPEETAQLLAEAAGIDILTQVAAATKALQAVSLGLLEDHIGHCVVGAAVAGGPEADAKLKEASIAIARLVKS